MTKDQLVAELRKQGYGRIADMLDAEVEVRMIAMSEVQDATSWTPSVLTPKKKAK